MIKRKNSHQKLLFYWNKIELYDLCVQISENNKLYYRAIRDFYKYLLKNDLDVIVNKNTYNS